MSQVLDFPSRTPRPARPPGAQELTPAAVSYIAGVISISLLGAVLICFLNPPHDLRTVAIWTLAVLAGELMVFKTVTARAHISLGTTVHLASILVLDPGQIAVTMWLSRGLVKFVVQRQPWYRALFNVSQASAAVLAASVVYRVVGGEPGIAFTPQSILHIGLAFAAVAITYYAINTGTVSGVVASTSRDSFWRTWRENYGYAAEILSTAGLALLAPVTAFCYQEAGWVGLMIFLVPMLLVRASSVRYIELKRAQQALIASERLAAKGEIAAEVGHEIKNFLTVISGQIQIIRARNGQGSADVAGRLETVMKQVESINSLCRGLMDFAHKETRAVPTRLSDLVEQTVSFLKPQNRFDGVKLELDLDPRAVDVSVDPGQIQQALINLLINAANAMSEAATARRRISVWVHLHERPEEIEIGVADSGPGVPADIRDRVFEPGFTTRADGHGFGLSTVYRVVANHNGTINVEDETGGGAVFRISIPVARRKAA